MGAACAEELTKLHTPANAERVMEAMRLVAAGKINQAQVPGHLHFTSRAACPAPRTGIVKAGRFKFAD